MDLYEIINGEEFKELTKNMLEHSKALTQNKYEQLNEIAEIGETVIIGDSIVEGFPVSEMFDKRIYNRGISGDTSLELIKRLKRGILPLKPKKVFIWIGTNDIQADISPVDTINNVKKVCEVIINEMTGAEINIISIAPINSQSNDPLILGNVGKRSNEIIEQINEGYANLCAENGYHFIDIFSKLCINNSLRDEFSHDGLHLTIKGYKPVCEELKKYL